MKKAVVAGHICLDITPVFRRGRTFSHVEELLEPGKLINMDGVSAHTGGAVANTGIAMKLLGCDVELVGKIGDDAFGQIVQKVYESYGATGLVIDPSVSTSYTVALAIPGIDRILLHDPGANDTFVGSDISDKALEGAALFHFGYPPLMRKMFADGGEELSGMYRRIKEKGIATSLDMAAVDPASESGKADWEKILGKTLPYVDIFVPSFEELCYMLDRDTFNMLAAKGGNMVKGLDIEKYARPLAEKCIDMGCAIVLVKCGVSGMYYMTAGRERIENIGRAAMLDPDDWADREGPQICYKAYEVKSGTGAGDLAIAAFLTAVLQGETPEMCAKLASAEGTASLASYDALGAIRQLSDLKEQLAAGWPEEDQ